VRNTIAITTVHINNGGFGGYGPGFWGAGHHPYTSMVSDHSIADMSKAVQGISYYAEDVTEPSEIIPAMKRAFAENEHGRPAYLEFMCSLYPVYGAWSTLGPPAH
jgi:thiamine pyrophosphate-dependent acetolactate synthase large subunit-like protein